MEELEHIMVGECLLLTDTGDLPVARFEITYEINSLPTLNIVPALGRPLEEDADYITLDEIQENSGAVLTIEVNGETHILLEGTVVSIGGDDNASSFRRTLSANITVLHKGIILAGAPSSSFVYSGNNNMIETLVNTKVRYKSYGAFQDTQDDFHSVSGLVSNINSRVASANNTSEVVSTLCESIMADFRSDVDITDLLIPFEGAALDEVVLPAFSYIQAIATRYRQGWGNANNWQALVDTCRFLDLAIVPTATQLHIGNPFSLARTPDIELTSNEILSMKQIHKSPDVVRVDGVIVKVPRSGVRPQDIIAYPPLENKNIVDHGKYYRVVQMPSWAYPFAAQTYGPAAGGKISYKARNAVEESPGAPPTNVANDFQTIGERLAKVRYANLRMGQNTVQLTLPFRTDLMPGTNIKVHNDSTEDMSFIGSSLYGMITRTRIVGDMMQDKGRLNTYISVGSVRGETDNSDNDLTFEGNPLYSGAWAALNIKGEPI